MEKYCEECYTNYLELSNKEKAEIRRKISEVLPAGKIGQGRVILADIKFIRFIPVDGRQINCCNGYTIAEKIEEVEIDDKRYYRIKGRCGSCKRMNTKLEEIK